MAVKVDFKPEALEKIARDMGHNGNMSKFPAFLASDPAKQHLMERYKKYAGDMVLKAARGTQITNRKGEYRSDISAADVAKAKSLGVPLPEGTKVTSKGHALGATTGNRSTAQAAAKDFSKAIADAELFAAQKANNDKARAEQEAAAAAQADPVVTDPAAAAPAAAAPAAAATTTTNTTSTPSLGNDLGSDMANMATTGTVPDAAVVKTTSLADAAAADPTTNITAGTGEVTGTPTATATPATQAADIATPAQTEAAKIKEERVKEGTDAALGQLTTEQLDPDDPRLQIDAAQQTESSVSDLDAAQGEATLIGDEAPIRTVGDDELVGGKDFSGSTVDMDRVGEAFGTGEVKAASVVDEITTLMKQFEDGNTPPWAAGAMRNASAQMSARGLGASSMAGQALMQAAMEATLPIAQMEAGNKQAMALEKARYRAEFMKIDFDQKFQTKVLNAAKIENAANMQFSADQQIVLENSRTVNTMNLQNLSNKQSMVLAEASALANLDMANLNNRQQAEVMNAQNFLQVDMANMSNRQQVEMFKAQQRIGALFSDQAAGNAAQQFNASSENQMEQFFKNLQTQVQQFNSSQTNAMEQFNAGQSNSVSQFNTQIQNQRDQFNAQNQLVIAQSNAQWRRQIATSDTAATNRANEVNAQNALNVSQQAYANMWQERADNMKRAWESGENSQSRLMQIALQELENEGDLDEAAMTARTERRKGIGAWLRHVFPFT